MSIAFCEAAIPGRHTITFRIRDAHRGFPCRKVDVLATPDELAAFVQNGYLVRENLLPQDEIVRLRAALDDTVARDTHLETQNGRAFGGVFIRHLMDKHPAFLEMLDFPPTLSVARALLGPTVSVRGFTGRICDPGDPRQETEWHFHQRVLPDPLPPWLTQPHTIDVLLYLDDLNDLNGPLCVLPGSHQWTDRDLDAAVFDDLPGQVLLRLPAGSAVLTHGSLWHRALPTQPSGTMRRLLLFGYGSASLKPSIYGTSPEDGLIAQLLRRPDVSEDARELLGVSGYM